MKLLLMFPDDLPETTAALRAQTSAHVAELGRALTCGEQDADRLYALVRDIPLRPDGVKLDRWEWHEPTRRTDQYAILDAFFGVIRTATGAPEMFAHSAAVAYRALLADTLHAGTDLGGAQWSELRWGMEQIIRFSIGAPRTEQLSTLDSVTSAGAATRDPHRRWRTGHQLFFPLVQAIVVGLRCFFNAVLDGEREAAHDAIVFATDVMRASARAIEFAGDFGAGTYTTSVRPSMTPPGVPQALSGLMSADHHRLVVCYHELRPIVADLNDGLQTRLDEFVESVEHTYAAHQVICSRFNGDKVVSLRMSHSSHMTAAEVLDQLGKARVKTLRRPA